MRISNAVLLSLGAAKKVDPCWFVGLRLAKAPAACKDGICEGIGIQDNRVISFSLNPRVVPVSCNHASGIMNTFFPDQSSEQRPSKRARIEFPHISFLLDPLENVIIPDVQKMLFCGGKHPLESSTIAAMSEIDRALLLTFEASSETEWTIIKDFVSQSDVYQSFLHVSELILLWTQRQRVSMETVQASRAPLLHFLFDLLSLIGRPDGLTMTALEPSTREANIHAIVHRYQHPMESHIAVMPWEEMPPNMCVALAAILTHISLGRVVERAHLRILARVIARIDGEPEHGHPAAVAILRSQLRSSLCPIVDEVIEASDLWSEMAKETVSLINLCRGYLPSYRLLAASRRISRGGASPHWLRTADGQLILHNLKRNDVPWVNGFDDSVHARSIARYVLVEFVIRHSPLIDKGGFNILRPKTSFDSDEDFENTMKGLGRAIGLCARYYQKVGTVLRFPVEYFKAIFEDVDPVPIIREQDHGRTVFQDWIGEPMFFLRLGIQDVLGIAGLYVYSPQSWLYIAVHSSA